MTPFLRKLLGQNWLLLLTMLALAVFGVVAIYSATSTRADSNAVDFWRKQANWVVVGVFAFMLTSLIHYRWIRWGALPMYLAGIVFLILTKFIGTKVYGARSWLHLGPVNFQPAQLAVIAGIMVLALFLTQFREMHPMLRLLLCGAISTSKDARGRSINLSLRSAQAAGQAKGLRRQTRRSSSDSCLPLPCTTTTFSPPSASNGDLLEECFFWADSPYS